MQGLEAGLNAFRSTILFPFHGARGFAVPCLEWCMVYRTAAQWNAGKNESQSSIDSVAVVGSIGRCTIISPKDKFFPHCSESLAADTPPLAIPPPVGGHLAQKA